MLMYRGVYVVAVVVALAALAEGNIMSGKVDAVGIGNAEPVNETALLLKALDKLDKDIAALEKEIEELQKRSCTSKDNFQAEIDGRADDLQNSQNNQGDMSDFLSQDEFSEEEGKVTPIVNNYKSMTSSGAGENRITSIQTSISALKIASENQIENLTDIERDIKDLLPSDTIYCTVGWTLNENHCYAFFRSSMTWYDAVSTCVEHEANLVEINSPAEHEWLRDFLVGKGKSWTGATDAIVEGNWRWVGSGQNMSTEVSDLWGNGQPDNYDDNEHTMELSENRELNDIAATRKASFVCEQWLPHLM